MLAKIAALGLENWTVEEKRELLDVVSDSLDDIEEEEFEIPAWHLEEIERRLKGMDANPQPGIPVDQVLARLEAMQ